MSYLHARRIAKKRHKCAYGNHDIMPGEAYFDEVMAPWDRIADDVDDEGRTITSRFGEWAHTRYHSECRDQVERGYW